MNISFDNEKYYFGPTRLLTKTIHLKSSNGIWDFTINTGDQHQPIYISSVVWNSPAYLQGMRPGDEILSLNGTLLQSDISYSQALQMINSTSELDLIIRTLRVNSLDATLYDWYDPVQQRSTSPPPSTYLSPNAQLPYFERTVSLKVEKGKRLGLVIRGGAEYGLGIFISGVDKGSLSDQSGLCIGDQILSVNGIDFRHIRHTDAVQLLRNINQMSFHLRQINKLPKPKDLIQTPPLINTLKQSSSTTTINTKKNFLVWILDSNNKIKLKHLMKEYLEEQIPVDQLTRVLFEILNSQNEEHRDQLIESIRKFIRSNDLDRYEISLLKSELNQLKLSHERLISSSRMSIHSSNEYINRSQSLMMNEKNPRENLFSLRKSASVENIFGSMNIIEEFLQDYSSPYPITIHKVRPTLGVAIEGGFEDRIPLPRIVYIQPDGCAYVSSGLHVGHVIVGLNNYSMKGLSHREAALFLASAFKDKNSSQMNLLVVEPLNDQ